MESRDGQSGRPEMKYDDPIVSRWDGIDRRRAIRSRITVMRYNETYCREETYTAPVEALFRSVADEIHWIHIDGVHDAGLVEYVGIHYSMHPLIIEDIMHTEQRVKIEDYGDHIYFVLRILYPATDGKIVTGQLSIVLLADTVVTFSEIPEPDFFRPLRERLQAGRGRLRRLKADYLFYAITDFVVDQYFPLVEIVEKKMSRFESEFDPGNYGTVFQEIMDFNRKIMGLMRWIRPVSESVLQLNDMDSDLVDDQVLVYFRDVHDHAIRITETLEMFKEGIVTLFTMYTSLMGHRMNEIMKVLTVMGSIFIPLTFLAGVYGMNFHFMPGLENYWGFHTLVTFMIIMVVLMLLWFRKKNIL